MTRSRSESPDNNLYGKFDLDMSTRLDIRRPTHCAGSSWPVRTVPVDEAELVRWYGRWQPWTVNQVAGLLEDWPHPWWIAGGFALDAFTGLTRSHDDIDIAVFRRDIPALRAHLGASYHFWAAGSGALRPLTAEEPQLPGWADQCWVREHSGAPGAPTSSPTPTATEHGCSAVIGQSCFH